MSRIDDKRRFISQLAKFLCENEAGKSITIELEQKVPPLPGLPRWGHEWSQLRSASPIHGWKTVEEAEQILTEFLC